MTSNTKEYQREYQKEYRKSHPQKQYKKKVKTEVKKVKIKDLSPPRAPMVEKSVEGNVRGSSGEISVIVPTPSKVTTDSKTIDPFLWLSSNHSFQMVMMEFVKRFVPGMERIKTRGTKEVLKNSFSKARQELMIELKQVLEMRKK